MALVPGVRLGAYEIVGLLGAGGMGEVYRARDTRLQRDIAIKILPELFALDPERRARFEREAQVLASLNHPHIAAIYGFEGSGTGAIVMELVEGPTLADRIADGRVPLIEALAIAEQIASALDAAHEKGIIHRDLKPANITLTADGTVKVLDFGLAKALNGESTPANVTHSPTMSAVGTRAGVILGTAAYMSPEQARGQMVDKRTDIWAFGCVLYELLTARKAFSGDTVSDAVAAILTQDPDWSLLPRDTPPRVRELLRRCLEKEPRKRLRDIGDAPIAVTPERPAQRARVWPITAAAFAAGAAIAIAIVWPRDRPAVSTGSSLSDRTIATRLTDYGESQTWPAISPDGRSFVFVSGHAGNPDIWLRQVTGGEPIRLTNDPAEESELAFAPDGEAIYFTRNDRDGIGIWQVGLLGGQPRKLLTGARSAAPSPDGKALAYAQADAGAANMVVRGLEDQHARIVAQRINVGGLVGGTLRAAWARDGRRLSYVRAGLFAPANLFIADVATGTDRQVTRFTRGNEGVSGHAWLDDRHIVVTYVPFPRQQGMADLGILDAESGSITRLTMAVNEGFSTPSVSADGSRMIVTAQRNVRGVWTISSAAGVPPVQVMDAQGDPMWTYVTRDGRTLLVNSTISGSRNLWVRPVAQPGGMMQITFIPADAIAHSSLSPDGTRVAFASAATGNSDIWVQNVDGTALRQLTNDAAADSWPIWSPDGEWVAFQAIPSANRRAETWRVPSNGGTPQKIVDGGVRGDWVRQPSGSGTWIVSSVAGGGATAVRLIDVERRAVVWEVPVPGSSLSLPMVGPDGRTFSMPYAVARDRDAIGIFDLATGAQRSALQLPFHVLFRASWIDEGRAFLVNRTDTLANVALFDRFWKR